MQRQYWNRLLKYFVTRVASKNDEHSETGNDWRLVIGPTLSGAHIYRSNIRDPRIIDFSRAKIKFISTSRTHQHYCTVNRHRNFDNSDSAERSAKIFLHPHSWRFKCSGHCWPTASWTDRWSMAFFWGIPIPWFAKKPEVSNKNAFSRGKAGNGTWTNPWKKSIGRCTGLRTPGLQIGGLKFHVIRILEF